MPTSNWSNELNFLIDPLLLKETQFSSINLKDKTLTIEQGDVTLVYSLRVSSFAAVVDVTVILFNQQPMRRVEARVAYNVEADSYFRQFWYAAVDEISRRSSEAHDSRVDKAIKVVKDTLKGLKETQPAG